MDKRMSIMGNQSLAVSPFFLISPVLPRAHSRMLLKELA